MAERKAWIVTASEDRPVGDVAKDLTANGFTVAQVLGEMNVITGAAREELIEKLRAIPGVLDISPDLPIDIGPPDAPVTW